MGIDFLKKQIKKTTFSNTLIWWEILLKNGQSASSVSLFSFLGSVPSSEPACLAPGDGHVGRFQFGVITNKADVNVHNGPL